MLKTAKTTLALENLLTLLWQAGASIKVANGQLWIRPAKVANHYREQITRLKGEILFSLDYCPVCASPLEYTEATGDKGIYRLAWCEQNRNHCERATKL